MSDKDDRILELERRLARTEGERDEARRQLTTPAPVFPYIAPYVCWCGVRHWGGHYHIQPQPLVNPVYPYWTTGTYTVSDGTLGNDWQTGNGDAVANTPSIGVALQLPSGPEA